HRDLEHRPPVEQVAQPADGTPEVEAVGNVVHPAGEGEEVPVPPAGVTAGRELVQLAGHGLGVGDEVEDAAVVEEAAPLRVEGDQVEVVFESPAGLVKDAGQDGGQGEDRRAHV